MRLFKTRRELNRKVREYMLRSRLTKLGKWAMTPEGRRVIRNIANDMVFSEEDINRAYNRNPNEERAEQVLILQYENMVIFREFFLDIQEKLRENERLYGRFYRGSITEHGGVREVNTIGVFRIFQIHYNGNDIRMQVKRVNVPDNEPQDTFREVGVPRFPVVSHELNENININVHSVTFDIHQFIIPINCTFTVERLVPVNQAVNPLQGLIVRDGPFRYNNTRQSGRTTRAIQQCLQANGIYVVHNADFARQLGTQYPNLRVSVIGSEELIDERRQIFYDHYIVPSLHEGGIITRPTPIIPLPSRAETTFPNAPREDAIDAIGHAMGNMEEWMAEMMQNPQPTEVPLGWCYITLQNQEELQLALERYDDNRANIELVVRFATMEDCNSLVDIVNRGGQFNFRMSGIRGRGSFGEIETLEVREGIYRARVSITREIQEPQPTTEEDIDGDLVINDTIRLPIENLQINFTRPQVRIEYYLRVRRIPPLPLSRSITLRVYFTSREDYEGVLCIQGDQFQFRIHNVEGNGIFTSLRDVEHIDNDHIRGILTIEIVESEGIEQQFVELLEIMDRERNRNTKVKPKPPIPTKELQLTELITVRLEAHPSRAQIVFEPQYETNIYIAGKKFRQCKYLLLNLEVGNTYEEIESIDDAAIKLGAKHPARDNESRKKYEIPPETEYWGHCSNLQAWCENDYNPNLLHTNLSLPLLGELVKHKDNKALKALRDYVYERIEKVGYKAWKTLSPYLRHFNDEERKQLKELAPKPRIQGFYEKLTSAFFLLQDGVERETTIGDVNMIMRRFMEICNYLYITHISLQWLMNNDTNIYSNVLNFLVSPGQLRVLRNSIRRINPLYGEGVEF